MSPAYGRCACCYYNGISVAWCPAFVLFILPATFTICYLMALHKGHIVKFWPYISDTGTTWPESAIFGQLLNMAALASAFTFYFWHRFAMRWLDSRCHIIFARITLVIGLFSAFGLSLVANFQEQNIMQVHDLGAVLCFGLGFIYSFCNAIISLGMVKQHIAFAAVRIILAILSMFAFATTFIADIIARKKFDGTNSLLWGATNKGYTEHIVSSIAEWIMALLFALIIATMIPDLYHYSAMPTTLKYRWHDEEAGPRQKSLINEQTPISSVSITPDYMH